MNPVTGLPTQPVETLSSATLGYAVFTPTADGDTAAALSLTLAPGTYGLVFGSGLFGTAGIGDLLHGNDTLGAPSIFINPRRRHAAGQPRPAGRLPPPPVAQGFLSRARASS